MNHRWVGMLGAGLGVVALLSPPPGARAARPFSGTPAQVNDPTAGVIQTVAGGSVPGAGPLDSTFFQPYGAARGSDGTLYIADTYDNQIKAVDRAGKVVVIAGTGDAGQAGDGGPARTASLNFPMAVAIGPDEALYVADTWNDRVRRIDQRTGIVTTVVGNGPDDATGRNCGLGHGRATDAVISQPHGISLTTAGDLLVADTGCDVIERVSTRTGTIKVVAGIEGRSGLSGDGPAVASLLANPLSVTTDPLGNPVLVDTSSHLFYVNLLGRPVTLFPTSTRPLIVAPGYKVTIATIGDSPWVAGFGSDGSLLVSDATSVRRLDWATGALTTVAGTGATGAGPERATATGSPLSYPSAVFGDGRGGFIVVDRGNSRVRDVSRSGNETTVAGRPNSHGPALGDGLPAIQASLDEPDAVAVGRRGLYIADPDNQRIRRVDPDGRIVTVLGRDAPCVRMGEATAGCGIGPIDQGTGLAVSPKDLLAFVDAGRVSVLNDSDQTVVVAGGSLTPGEARPVTAPGALRSPAGLAFSAVSQLLVSEQGANRIDRVDLATGSISPVAGATYQVTDPLTWLDGPAGVARFSQPTGLAVAKDGTVYVADTGNNRIRRIDPHHRSVSTFVGNGMAGFLGDGGPAGIAELAYPTDVVVAPDKSLLIVDWGNERIRPIPPASFAPSRGVGPAGSAVRAGRPSPAGTSRATAGPPRTHGCTSRWGAPPTKRSARAAGSTLPTR